MARPRTTPKPRNRLGNYETLPSGNIRARYRGEKQTFATMSDAVAWVAGLAADLSRGVYVSPRKSRTPIEQIAEEWKLGISNVRKDTRRRYILICDRTIIPMIGKKSVNDFDRLAVKQFLVDLGKPREVVNQKGEKEIRKRKPGTVRNVKAVLSLILEAAVDGKYITTNPCEGVEVKRSRPEEMIFLNHDEVLRVADAVASHFRLAVLIGAYCGLRAEELWALQVKHLDEVGKRFIVKTVGDGDDEFDDEDDMPKTGRYRSVPIPIPLVIQLKAWIKTKELEMDDLLVQTIKGNRVQHNNFYNRYWIPAVEKSGIKKRPRFHDLRHTCAAFYFKGGAPSEMVRQVLGHTTIAMTHKYAHIFPEAFNYIVDVISEDIESAMSEVHVPRSATKRTSVILEIPSDQDFLEAGGA